LGNQGGQFVGDLNRIEIRRNVDSKSIDGRERVVVLEIIHEIVGDRGRRGPLQLDMVVDELCLEV
jgi:hypothetical protein